MRRRSFLAIVAAGVITYGFQASVPSNGQYGIGGHQVFAGEPINEVGLPEAGRPVVVELYTSQGCNTCPPADQLAGELSVLPGILPLSFHVDYWDYIGWRDPFALPGNAKRQKEYARALGSRFVYTPQMVIDGHIDAAGHRQRAVFGAIDKASQDLPVVDLSIDPGSGLVRIGVGEAPLEGASVWLVVFDKKHTTDISRGENAGRTLSYFNVVRGFYAIGHWRGEAMEISLDLARAQDNDACAVILQAGTNGRILGAATMPLRQDDS